MRRYWPIAALLLLSATMLSATAWAGGTVVTADERLSDDECVPGWPAPFLGFDAGATVLGCLAGPARDYLAAAEGPSAGRYICFYLAPEGYENAGPCLNVAPSAERRRASPLTGRRAPMVLGAGRIPGEGPVHIWGVGAPATASVAVEAAGSDGPVAAALLDTEVLGTANQVLPFAIFVAELPESADLCAPAIVRAFDHAGEALGSARVSDNDRAFPSPPLALAGSRHCGVSLLMPALAKAMRSFALTLVLG